jgi:exodeoxyribonuclease VIII
MSTTFAQYRAIPAINWSLLHKMAESPLAYHYAETTDDDGDTASRMFLRAVHCLTLEPAHFARDFGVAPGTRTAELKAAYKAAGKTLLTEKDAALARAIAYAVDAHPVAWQILDAPGRSESNLTWTDPDTGLRCKCRRDRVVHPATDDAPIEIWDLKTYKSASQAEVRRAAKWQGWIGQLAYYRWGTQIKSPGRTVTAGLIVVAQKPPHDVGVYRFLPADLDEQDEHRRELLARVKECQEAGEWPGCCTEIQDLSLEWDDTEIIMDETPDTDTEKEPF